MIINGQLRLRLPKLHWSQCASHAVRSVRTSLAVARRIIMTSAAGAHRAARWTRWEIANFSPLSRCSCSRGIWYQSRRHLLANPVSAPVQRSPTSRWRAALCGPSRPARIVSSSGPSPRTPISSPQLLPPRIYPMPLPRCPQNPSPPLLQQHLLQ